MVTAWYTLVVGIIASLNGIIFLIFPLDGFTFPNWYLGIMLLVGVIGVILGIIGVNKKGKQEAPTDRPDTNNTVV